MAGSENYVANPLGDHFDKGSSLNSERNTMDTLRVGVIGYGYWGPNLTRNFYELPSADLVAIADLREERRKEALSRFPHLITAQDYHDLFDLGLDAIVISTPPATHHPIARECLEHNLHVLVE